MTIPDILTLLFVALVLIISFVLIFLRQKHRRSICDNDCAHCELFSICGQQPISKSIKKDS